METTAMEYIGVVLALYWGYIACSSVFFSSSYLFVFVDTICAEGLA